MVYCVRVYAWNGDGMPLVPHSRRMFEYVPIGLPGLPGLSRVAKDCPQP